MNIVIPIIIVICLIVVISIFWDEIQGRKNDKKTIYKPIKNSIRNGKDLSVNHKIISNDSISSRKPTPLEFSKIIKERRSSEIIMKSTTNSGRDFVSSRVSNNPMKMYTAPSVPIISSLPQKKTKKSSNLKSLTPYLMAFVVIGVGLLLYKSYMKK